jgi:hypothetical protein
MDVWIVTEQEEGKSPYINVFFDYRKARQWADMSPSKNATVDVKTLIDSRVLEVAVNLSDAVVSYLSKNSLMGISEAWDKVEELAEAFELAAKEGSVWR